MNSLNKQIGGDHYKDFSIQPIKFIYENKISFIEGNIIKYVCRYSKKGRLEDLEKAAHYLEILIENEKLKTQNNKNHDSLSNESDHKNNDKTKNIFEESKEQFLARHEKEQFLGSYEIDKRHYGYEPSNLTNMIDVLFGAQRI